MGPFVVTLTFPLCLGAPCAPGETAPARPAIHFGDCRDLDHLPVQGYGTQRLDALPAGTPTVYPCGGRAR